MMANKQTAVVATLFLLALVFSLGKPEEQEDADSVVESVDEEIEVDPEKIEYAKGSVCGYCTYCKFCKLCDQDCPCETSNTKPNCRMCKYCKYCKLCSAVCETVCKPGGILDRVSGALVNSLPTFNRAEVDDDIDSVKHWINQKKDEL